MAPSLSRIAPAKINLCLHVTGQRADGYHLLESLVVFTRFGDRLTVSPSSEDRFEIIGPYAAGLPVGPENLVLRARDLLRDELGDAAAVSIVLEKNLPAASGMGGGSSDAASTLLLLNALWEAGLERDRLAELSLGLGADVPMCIHERPMIARGIGEELVPLEDIPAMGLLLINPGVPVSTPDVFRALARKDNAALPAPANMQTPEALVSWLSTTRNDLQEAACRIAPQIENAILELEKHDALLARMTGSGATCFGIYTDFEEAGKAADAIAQAHPEWFVTATSTL